MRYTDPFGENPALAGCGAAFLVGGAAGSVVSFGIGCFSDKSWKEITQNAICDGLQGGVTAFGACIGLNIGNPIMGGCLGGAIGALLNGICNIVGDLCRGVRTCIDLDTVKKTLIKTAINRCISIRAIRDVG